MGMIYGQYDAKEGKKGEEVGFVPGGSSIHACMYDTLSMPDEHRCHYLYRFFFLFLAAYFCDPFEFITHLLITHYLFLR